MTEISMYLVQPGKLTIEALYLFVLDFEYSTLKAIKFCAGLY
jgi:hypothetical protein